MFKNPLKYQSDGSTPTQQQQDQLVQLFQAAAQNAQVDPEALVKKAQELGQDENAAAQFMEGLQRCAQGDPAGIQFIKSLFTSSHKRGGKIQDFICKHARGGQVAGCGCGGSVKKAEGGETMPYTRGSYQSSDYFNNTGTWIATPNGLAQNYRPYTFGGRTWGIGGNDLEQILVIPGEYGTPRRAVRRISNWFNPDVPTERLDTTYQDANGNRRNSAEFEARVNRELEGISGRRPTTKENGGKVEKAQGGIRVLQPGEETIWDIKKDTLGTGVFESHKWAKNDSTLPRSENEVRQFPGQYSRLINGKDTILVRQTPMFKFYRSSLDPLHEIVTYPDGTPAGTNTYRTRDSWNKENQYHDKLK